MVAGNGHHKGKSADTDQADGSTPETLLPPFVPDEPFEPGERPIEYGAEEEIELELGDFVAQAPPPPAPMLETAGESLRPGRIRTAMAQLRPSVVTGGASATPLLILFALNAADELDKAALGVLLPEIRDWFGVSLTFVLTATSITGLFGILFAVPIGYFADRWNRVRMTVAGAATWGIFTLFTGLAPTVALLFVARFGSGIGKTLDPAHSSLLADYYPPHVRTQVFSFHRMANSAGQMVAPLAAGLLASMFFWQLPFIIFAIPSVALAVLAAVKLREPVRGEQERRALGANEEDALAGEKPPTWTESWRIAKNVRTLRRIWIALPFLVGSSQVIKSIMSLYYDEVFGLNAAQRGTIAALDEPFQLAGLIVGAAVSGRFLRYRPGRVMTYIGALAAARAASLALIAVAPILPVAVALSWIGAFVGAVFAPATLAMMTLVIPPRARGFALSLGTLFIIPGLAIGPFAGSVADTYGLRVGLLLMVPVYLVGAFIMGSSSSGVDADIRQAQAAAMAGQRSRDAQRRGDAQLVVCRDLDVHYGSVQILFNVDFEVAEGELIALLGTNGAGKSTLLRAISGLTPPSNGAVFVDGEDISYLPPSDHAARGIIQVPGGRGVFPSLTVRENLRLAGWLFRKDSAYVAEATERVLGFFPRLRERLDEAAGNLSGGEQQMLTLGQAFLSRPRLLMIDELSLGLAPAVVEKLLQIVRAIHAQGTTIILVEQSVNVALTVANRAVFMEKGEIRFSGPTSELLRRPDILRSVYLKGSGGGTAPRRKTRSSSVEEDIVLEVRDVRKEFGGVKAINGISLQLRRGETLGLIGPNGAGKTTLFDLISGFVTPDSGEVLLNGTDITLLPPDQRAKLGLYRSFQDARLYPSLTVAENIKVALERHVEARSTAMAAFHLPKVRRAEARLERRAERLIALVGIGEFQDKFVRELSTGSRRLVDLACVLAADPDVLLVDEPSSGIAQAETEELGPLLQRIKFETACSVLLIEHDMRLISAISDELIALETGTVITRGAPSDVLEHPRVVEAYLGTSEEVIRRSGAVT